MKPDRYLALLLALRHLPTTASDWAMLTDRAEQTLTNAKLLARIKPLIEEGLVQVHPGPMAHLHYHVRHADTFQLIQDAAEAGLLQRAWTLAAASLTWGDRGVTELRIATVAGDADLVRSLIKDEFRWNRERSGPWLAYVYGIRPKTEWLSLLQPSDAAELVNHLAEKMLRLLHRADPALLRAMARFGDGMTVARYVYALGEVGPLGKMTERQRRESDVIRHFMQGDYSKVLVAGDLAIEKLPKRTKKRRLHELEGALLALVAATEPRRWPQLRAQLELNAVKTPAFGLVYSFLRTFLRDATQSEGESADDLWLRNDAYPISLMSWVETLTAGLICGWLEYGGSLTWITEPLERELLHCEEQGLDHLASEFRSALMNMHGKKPTPGTLASRYTKRALWEISLEALTSVRFEKPEKPEEQPRRILWEVELEPAVRIVPRVGSLRSAKGKKVAISTLAENYGSAMSLQDFHILAAAKRSGPAWHKRVKLELGVTALRTLVDHPHVLLSSGASVTVSVGEPSLHVDDTGEDIEIRIEPEALLRAPITCIQRGASLVVYERTPAIEQLVGALNGRTLRLPPAAAPKLGSLLSSLAGSVPISASGGIEIEGEERPADARPVFLLDHRDETLVIKGRVAPLGIDAPLAMPGSGNGRFFARIDARPVFASRDANEELARLRDTLAASPVLRRAWNDEAQEARIGDGFEKLEVLLELQELELAKDGVRCLWPKGRSLNAPVVKERDALRVAVSEQTDWLGVDVELEIDEQTVLTLGQLLKRRTGRFIELDGEKIVALSRDLVKRLDALEGLGKRKSGQVHVPHAALPILKDLAEGSTFTPDAEAQKRIARLDKAARLKPRIPGAFKGELRAYQKEGFVWMARLAASGLGAVLADDMGLGKTIQTLALLCGRKKSGPALVAAPASVASNWRSEAAIFAPSLRVFVLSDHSNAERKKVLSSLRKGDLLICTYGRLVTEAEALLKIHFGTLIFDEAHYLKNASTQRAKAAQALHGDFRISLTGTPIENHLGELWNLMQTTVPGLLGSKKRFADRYASPIAEGDEARTVELRALLQPFLLRRTKQEVLGELPERTDITMVVTPTAEEQAFYEATRRRALEKIEGEDAGRIQILAELTRLRQAAVDPRLLEPAVSAGAKIETLVTRLTDLKNEGHRALVFSQFLGGLHYVGESLDAAGISYFRLDGSTPSKKRKTLIDKFQNGEADVFLMSLKAGGIGVNLTGADYVIHLDPWWNPAVEEQASARSHRMGQTRPVTVYRLITQGTIEEKILALHAKKRALAEDLLSNMQHAQTLDLEALRALL